MRRLLLAVTLLCIFPMQAFALPGELAAVERHCGQPRGESRETSPITNRLQRTLYYNGDVLLHFEPEEGGWSFTTGWHAHSPISRNELEQRLPCFRNAMQEVAGYARNPAIDPSSSQQVTQKTTMTFGIPNFWLIVGLSLLLVLVLVVPSARQRRRNRIEKRNAAILSASAAHAHHPSPDGDPVPARPHRHTEPDLYQ